jgi:hypothetical protein
VTRIYENSSIDEEYFWIAVGTWDEMVWLIQRKGEHPIEIHKGTIYWLYDNKWNTILPIGIASFPDEKIEIQRWDNRNASLLSTFAQWLQNLQTYMSKTEHNFEFVKGTYPAITVR